MKSLVALLLFVFFVQQANAQSLFTGPEPVRPRINADLQFALPYGAKGGDYAHGAGLSLGIDVPVTRIFYGTLSGGFMAFYQGSKSVSAEARSYIPAKAGAKLYVLPWLYAQGELGLGIGIQQGAGSVFIMSPGVGTSFRMTERSAINAGVRVERWSRQNGNIEQVAFKLGYQF